ncbi:transposase [Kineosporia babensis]|uniref:Transposase n=1 Tax=Kineosporia babensis TaxID=499548 RepID=A0A9X1NNP4_9ACTN|nr:transposase [Kineosporia babensis]MCD5316819.1 transposase [Kineosporia babensis]
MTSQGPDRPQEPPKGRPGPRAGQRKRRTFPAAYKARILAEYDQLEAAGDRGALLRREGLYHSHIQNWRKAAAEGAHAALAPSAGPAKTSTESAENRKLRKENARLQAELARSKAVTEAMGKMVALLETLSESADTQQK